MKELREAPKQAHLTMKNVSRMINTESKEWKLIGQTMGSLSYSV